MAPRAALLLPPLLAALAAAQLPPWPQSWRMNDSTIAMPCNFTGYTDPAAMAGWAVQDFDVRARARGAPCRARARACRRSPLTFAADVQFCR